jgi:hypothetical protein
VYGLWSVQPPPSASAMRRQARDPPTKPNSALPVVAGAQAAQLRRESEPGVPGQAFAMRLAQRLWDAYVRRMRRAIPKVGRPCTICGHRNHRQIDVALAAGTSQRAVSKSFKVSRSALQRHLAGHLPPPVVPAVALNEQIVPPLVVEPAPTTVDPRRHAPRWWTPSAPGPRRGDTCMACGVKDPAWWYIPGSWAGCECWQPAYYGVRKCQFFPRVGG